MAGNKKVEPRLRPIMHEYLKDLKKIGYGKSKADVAQRSIENAVLDLVEKQVIAQRNEDDLQN